MFNDDGRVICSTCKTLMSVSEASSNLGWMTIHYRCPVCESFRDMETDVKQSTGLTINIDNRSN